MQRSVVKLDLSEQKSLYSSIIFIKEQNLVNLYKTEQDLTEGSHEVKEEQILGISYKYNFERHWGLFWRKSAQDRIDAELGYFLRLFYLLSFSQF